MGTLLFSAFLITKAPRCIGPFVIMKYPFLSLVIFLVLKSIQWYRCSSCIMVTVCMVYSFLSFYLKLIYIFFNLKCGSYRQYLVGPYFFLSCLIIPGSWSTSIFTPLTFYTIIEMVGFTSSIVLFVFSISYRFFCYCYPLFYVKYL